MEFIAVLKVVCTGNPEKMSVAMGVKKLYPDCVFLSTSSGWNLSALDNYSLQRFFEIISESNVFINSSYIAPGIQVNLLDLVCKKWMEKDIKGHIINIGTTLEWSVEHQQDPYVISKRKFRDASLGLNSETGITGVKSTYVILGGINDGNELSQDYVDIFSVANVIDWILHYNDRISLIQVEKQK